MCWPTVQAIIQPTEWAQAAIALYRQHKADRIVAEVNNGGDMVEATLRMVDPQCRLTPPSRRSRGKVVRAEPVAALYEQGRVHHIGTFPTLEDQMCGFTTDFDRKTAGFSPDRVDALVWALTDLLVEPMPQWGIFEYTRQCAEAIRGPTPSPPQPEYAIGCVEWQRQQAAGRGTTMIHRVSGRAQNSGAVTAEQFRCGVSLNPLRAWVFSEKVSPVANATGPAIRARF